MKLNLNRKNYTATTADILKGFKIASPNDTINKLIFNQCSIARFGDGEFDMILRKRNKLSKV